VFTIVCPFCKNPDYRVADALIAGIESSEICNNHKLKIMNCFKHGNFEI